MVQTAHHGGRLAPEARLFESAPPRAAHWERTSMSDLPQTIEIGGGIGEGLRAARKPIVLSHVGTILPHWKLSALGSRTAKPHR